MGIITNDQDNSHPVLSHHDLSTCFFCGELIHDNKKDIGGFIYWVGNKEAIALHQSCAEIFGVRLIQDARSLVSEVGKICKLQEKTKSGAEYMWFYKDRHGTK